MIDVAKIVGYTLVCYARYGGELLRACFFVSLSLREVLFRLDLFLGLALPVLQARGRFGGVTHDWK